MIIVEEELIMSPDASESVLINLEKIKEEDEDVPMTKEQKYNQAIDNVVFESHEKAELDMA